MAASAAAYACTAETTFLQEVPAVHNTPEWIDAALPTLQRVAGPGKVVNTPPTLGYDDVSVFVNKYGGLYVMLGVQDVDIDGAPQLATPGGRGIAVNHNPKFYADDNDLVTGVRLHSHIAVDHLNGGLQPER